MTDEGMTYDGWLPLPYMTYSWYRSSIVSTYPYSSSVPPLNLHIALHVYTSPVHTLHDDIHCYVLIYAVDREIICDKACSQEDQLQTHQDSAVDCRSTVYVPGLSSAQIKPNHSGRCCPILLFDFWMQLEGSWYDKSCWPVYSNRTIPIAHA